MFNWFDKVSCEENLGKNLPVLETVVVEVQSMLNNQPLTDISTDLMDPEPLTPSIW